ncbi:hypothetical protein M3Y96_00380700 [Aphelenchoides besseyi]|nr:hypothetical protein M3Y96_00380700 [Aphelenchoides besseyi]
MRTYTILYVIYTALMQMINYYPTLCQLLTEDDLNRLWPTVNPVTLQLFEDRRIVLAMDPTIADFVWLDTLSILVSYAVPSIVMTFCTFLSFRSFQLQQDQLHMNTRRLYRTLLIVIVLEFIAAALMIAGPLVYYIIFTFYDTKFSSWLYKIFTVMLNLYPLLSDLIILIFIVPYRKAIISLLKFNRTGSSKSYAAPTTPIVVFTKTTRSLSVNPT